MCTLWAKPNAGKSTLMNALLGDKLAIVSPKIQTTRHRILGILSDEHFQLILSDSPGVIEQPKNKMHHAMMEAVDEGFHDADVFLLMVDVSAPIPPVDERHAKMKESEAPVVLVMNKIDLMEQEKVVCPARQIKSPV
jgi:GTP-binding protein Era